MRQRRVLSAFYMMLVVSIFIMFGEGLRVDSTPIIVAGVLTLFPTAGLWWELTDFSEETD